jgi:hypothetical protein
MEAMVSWVALVAAFAAVVAAAVFLVGWLCRVSGPARRAGAAAPGGPPGAAESPDA